MSKEKIANVMDKWWFGSSVFGATALILWATGGASNFYLGALVGMGVMSFTRLFWAPRQS